MESRRGHMFFLGWRVLEVEMLVLSQERNAIPLSKHLHAAQEVRHFQQIGMEISCWSSGFIIIGNATGPLDHIKRAFLFA